MEHSQQTLMVLVDVTKQLMNLLLVIMQQLVALKIKEGTNNGTHHVQLKSPNSLSGNVEFELPSADGSAMESS